MKNKIKNIKLYNIIFPIWFLQWLPITWIIVLPANFIYDLAVAGLTMKLYKMQDIKQNIKSAIIPVWLLGFLADLIGTAVMFASYSFQDMFQFINKGVSIYHFFDPVYDPFSSIYSFLWVFISVVITAFFIYIFNYKIALKKTNLNKSQKKKVALALAVFTAPYTFFISTSWFNL